MSFKKVIFASSFVLALTLSGCVEEYGFTTLPQKDGALDQSAPAPQPSVQADLPKPNSDICVDNPNAEACKTAPVVSTPGVVTVLFTVSQIPQGAATLILTNAMKYASPVANPKILFVKDSQTGGEDEGDADYIKNTLLLGYNVEYRVIVPGGLLPSEVEGKDLVIVSNPGFPLSDKKTLDTLNAFKGGVILVGDDLAHANGFSMDAFTGLTFKDNGTSLSCGGKTYGFDNLAGYNYDISMNSEFLPGLPADLKAYEYGNDIDISTPASGTQVLAWAKPEAGTCDIAQFPAVVRRPK